MQRRHFLFLGAGSALTLTAAGALVAAWRPGWREGRLSESTWPLFDALTVAVLGGLLPEPPPERALALRAQTDRLQTTIAGFAPAVQRELSDLLALLGTTAGRWALVGLRSDWSLATPAQVQAALQGLRDSRLAVRQQIYHALRDLSCAAFFAEPRHWAMLGYPGPRAL